MPSHMAYTVPEKHGPDLNGVYSIHGVEHVQPGRFCFGGLRALFHGPRFVGTEGGRETGVSHANRDPHPK